MQNVIIDEGMTKDPRFDEQLQALIAEYEDEVKKAEAKAPKGLKENPLTRLMKEGKFTVDYLKAEFPKIAAKSSSLPSSQREIIASTVITAAKRTVLIKQAERARKIEEKANAKAAEGEADQAPNLNPREASAK